MMQIFEKLKCHPVIYVSRDIERAIGFDLDFFHYNIISNYTPFAKSVAGQRTNILLIKKELILDTAELLQEQEVQKFINEKSGAGILVFKSNGRIEKICRKNNYKLLNPPAKLSQTVEKKISQVEWLADLSRYLPKTEIKNCSRLEWKQNSFILQFNTSHTGQGTKLIESASQLEQIKQKFPNRPARKSQYIVGPSFTINAVCAQSDVLLGNIIYQITGLETFSDSPFATVGNDWSLPYKLLNSLQKKQINEITSRIGEKLASQGWKGLYGADFVMDQMSKKIYLVEINARQPASASFESILQKHAKESSVGLTTFQAHLGALLDIDLSGERIIQIKDGAQIIKRIPIRSSASIAERKILEKTGFTVIEYENNKPGTDKIRIQSTRSLMSGHNQLNSLGEKILI